MKITSITLFHISIPFVQPYKLSKLYGTLTHAEAVILKMETDEGVTGWGEADPMNPFTEETPVSVMTVIRDHIAPHLLGKDPVRVAAIEHDLDQLILGNKMARGAINMALYDIAGKVHQLPAHTFLGGVLHEKLPLLGPIGSGTPEEDADAVESLITRGYRTVMIKMGALPIAEEVQRMKAAEKRFGNRITLIADANQGWTFKDALRFVQEIRGFEPTLLEQPISRYDIDGLSVLRNRAPCLLSADESLISVNDAQLLVRARAADVFSIKVSKNGGLTQSQLIAKLAEASGLKCLMNSMLEFGISQAASLQLGCTLKNLVDFGHAYMSVLRMSDDITDFKQNISNAVVSVPDRPGLGVRIDQEKLKVYTKHHIKIG